MIFLFANFVNNQKPKMAQKNEKNKENTKVALTNEEWNLRWATAVEKYNDVASDEMRQLHTSWKNATEDSHANPESTEKQLACESSHKVFLETARKDARGKGCKEAAATFARDLELFHGTD